MKIAMAVAMSDGSLDDAEGNAIKKLDQKINIPSLRGKAV